MARPTVSVLLPCRNARETLDECLASILSQTLPDLEVIAIDDHSTDGSDRKLMRAANSDARFRVFRSTRPGLVTALNIYASFSH